MIGLLLNTKTISGHKYLYPLYPFDWSALKRQLGRKKLRWSRSDFYSIKVRLFTSYLNKYVLISSNLTTVKKANNMNIS